MLVDEAQATFIAGHGGPGKVSFFKKAKAGPDGGMGGKGGDIYITVTSDLTALNQFSHTKLIKAPDGESGESNQKSGRKANDIEVKIPVGTEISDSDTGEIFEFKSPGERVLFCMGGIGGMGNYALRSARNTTPLHAQHGLPGQERKCRLILKLLADFGLIGLPNAGKSSLLNELTSANVKVANYPFTTLEPNLGVLEVFGTDKYVYDRQRKIIADIPGLILGAAEGKGLGIKFLKHIEKVNLLLHCISYDSLDVVADYKVVREELGKFNKVLLEKPEIILLTKTDISEKKDLDKKIKILKKMNSQVMPVSIYNLDEINSLRSILEKAS